MMPFDQGKCQITLPSLGPKGCGFQLTSALHILQFVVGSLLKYKHIIDLIHDRCHNRFHNLALKVKII